MDPLSIRAYEAAIKEHQEKISQKLNNVDEDIRTIDKERARLNGLRTILESGLFDPEFYLAIYPDIRRAGVDPLIHYVERGDREGRQPNAGFSAGEYRRLNMVGAPPEELALEHYILRGERAGLKVSSLFDPEEYFAANPSLSQFVKRPLFHFIKIGRQANLNIRPIGANSRSRTSGDSRPRIAAYLGVKDEVEIIEHSIAHLRAIGVDYIMACDMSSTDGTAELLEKYRSDDFSLLTLTNDAVSERAESDESWSYHCVRRCKSAPADWVIFLDADEFWLPASGSLKDCKALDLADVLYVERFNVVLGEKGLTMADDLGPANYDQVLLFAEGVPDLFAAMHENASHPWIMGGNMPKVMAKVSKIDGVTPGQHDIIRNAPIYKAKPNDLVIAHLALSTESRFQRKMKNIQAIYENEGIDLSLPGERWQDYRTGWHWRRWAAIAEAGGASDEFYSNTFSSDQIGQLRNEGVIKSAAEILSKGAIRGAYGAQKAK